MPIILRERRFGRSGSLLNRRIEYLLRGTEDDSEALQFALANSPEFWDGLVRGEPEIEQIGVDIWSIVIPYTELQPSSRNPQTGEVIFSFSLGLESQNIKQSLRTISAHAAPGHTANVDDFRGAINVHIDGGRFVVEGIDVGAPTSVFTYEFRAPQSLVTDAYLSTLEDIRGKVNETDWRRWEAGSLRLMGVTGTVSQSGDSNLVFTFEHRPNRRSITVGNISGIDVDGWDVLWILYGPDIDGAGKRIIARPIAAYVERVIERAEFRLLGF